MSVATQVLASFRAKGLHIVTAESCTGGLLSGALTDIAGSSDVFERGFVTYTNRAKSEMLGVLPATLAAHGAVSEEVAGEMATGALARSPAEVAIAITGIAGPGGSEFKPEGRVCFSMALKGGQITSNTQDFGALGRASIRQAAVQHALRMLATAATQSA